MRINDLKKMFSEIISELHFTTEKIQNTSNTRFSNLNSFRSAINKLEITDTLPKEIDNVYSSAIYKTNKDYIILNGGEAINLKTQLDNLIVIVRSLYNSFKKIGGKLSMNSISIKLPKITDFEDLSKFSSDFHKVLTQAIVNDKIKGQVRIDSVENGSIWLDVFLGTSTAVTLIGSLTWSAAVVFKKMQEGRIVEQHVKSLQIKNDSIKEIQLKQKESLNLMMQAEAKALFSENFEGSDNEQIERLKLSIKMLSELIEKGAEVHPALNQPENVTNLFPDMRKLNLIESRIKKLKE